MRILQICSGVLVNGAIVHALSVARALARRGHTVTMLCRPNSWIGEQLRDDPVEVIPCELRRWPPRQLREAAALVRQRRIEVIQTHMSSAHFFGILLRWLTGVPVVASAQSRHIQLHWRWNDCVVAASEATRRYHCRYNLVPARRTITIPNFVEPDRFVVDRPAVRVAMRQQFGLNDDHLCLICVADLFPRKGQRYLIDALAVIHKRFPSLRLLLVGPPKDPRYTRLVAERAKQLGVDQSIIWAGPRRDLPELFAAADVKVLSSLEETLPLAVLEAMAAGLPVVATAAGGTGECLEHGRTGLLVPPADVAALADAMAQLAADAQLREQFGSAGRERVRQQFSVEHHIAALEQVFETLIAKRRAA